jgi:hypothetical protein
MPTYDYKYLLHNDADLGHSGDEYSTNEVNFGVTTPNVNAGGKFGLHLVVTEAFTDLTEGVILWICHGASTAPTTKLSGMFIPVADLTLGAHFFIPCGSIPLLQYARALFDVVSTNATLGEGTMWFGDASDWSE